MAGRATRLMDTMREMKKNACMKRARVIFVTCITSKCQTCRKRARVWRASQGSSSSGRLRAAPTSKSRLEKSKSSRKTNSNKTYLSQLGVINQSVT